MYIAEALPFADTWGMHGDVGWGWMIGMMVLMVLFWGAIIFGVIWLIRGAVSDRSAPSETRISKASPIEILERRFAEGEITEEDFRERRDVLSNERPTGADGARKNQLATSPVSPRGSGR